MTCSETPRRIPGPLKRGVVAAFLTAALVLGGCAPHRPPVPPGEIPTAGAVSAEDEQYGQAVLAQLVERYPLDRDDQNIERVRDIADRLTTAANAASEPWHVYVLNDDRLKNAAATRGNYIFVWTGMLKVVENDDELATVIAHEIGHVLAGHTAPDPSEEVSRMIAGVAGAVTGHSVSARGGGPLADIANSLVKAAVEAVLVNPGSQSRELEADHIGLFLMADAGYDPNRGIDFWRRAQFDPDLSGAPLEFLSSHPSSEGRLEELQKHLPAAEERHLAALAGKAPVRDSPANAAPNTAPARADAPPSEPRSDEALEIEWTVDASIAPVYASPDRTSEVVAELAQGAAIHGTAAGREWVEITEPSRGFIEKLNLTIP